MTPKKIKDESDISKKYKKLTSREHVLQRPGMYIGPVENEIQSVWVVEKVEDTIKMVEKTLEYNPGILKLVDEIITNASDHARENEKSKDPVRNIKINIDPETNEISIFNDGSGIEIVKHPEHNVYIPELIFANFLTSSNYDDSQKRLKGGMNGLGSKIVGTFSTEFIVETVSKGNKYVQKFKNNLSEIEAPKITKYSKSEYTKITFVPDLKRFKIKEINPGTVKILEKRAYDLAACTDKKVSIYFNDERIKIRDFKEYTKLYLPEEYSGTQIFLDSDRWKVSILYTPFEKFVQVSFVNGLCTTQGGKHVDHIVNPIIKNLYETLKKKNESVKQSYIKENMMVFVIALIENPSFKSQSKEELTTPMADFGSRCDIDEKVLKTLLSSEICKNVLEFMKFKENKELNQSDGKKKLKLTGIPKLDDATKAGGKDSQKCTLILTEGDSAKTFAVSGTSVIGRDTYGIFPLRGKLLNVRTATVKQLVNNEEIKNLKTILGLQNKKFKNVDDIRKTMRYGKVMIICDQDLDGFHIKGLLVNFFHHFWPLLLENDPCFVTTLATPIVKAKKGTKTEIFYNLSEYEKWKEKCQGKWTIKYYKGLGTSTRDEAKECFKDLNKKQCEYFIGDQYDTEAILLAFDKKREDDRKEWIQKSTGKNLYLDNKQKRVPMKDFFNKEFVTFSIEDCERSIPNLMDGLKPSQRKVLYGTLSMKLFNEKKVFELTGEISSRTAYHHGDMSLNQTIIGMAQDFVGSNNINLLEPCGQFGSRIIGGKDSASPRYIFTKLNKITRLIFKEEDETLLEYNNDDGRLIEPVYYWPVIPMLLVNGASGIGTGYSTDIPSYDPKIVVKELRSLILNENHNVELVPFFRNFKGTIVQKENSDNWISRGTYVRKDRYSIQITELPVGLWTEKFKEHLDSLLEKEEINNFSDRSDDIHIDFTVNMNFDKLASLIEEDKVYIFFKLETTIKSSNLTFFNENKKLVRVKTPEEILYHFYRARLQRYDTRYKYLIDLYTSNLKDINFKIEFIRRVIDGTIKVFRVAKEDILKQLKEQGFSTDKENSYGYLLNLRIYNFSKEMIEQLESDSDTINVSLSTLKEKTYKDLWIEDLDELERAL